MNKNRWPLPRWLLYPVFGTLLFSTLISLLVYAARQQPADNTQCLKISPSSGPFAYVYFDAHSGTRLNMLSPIQLTSHFEQFSFSTGRPDGVYRAKISKLTATPERYLSL